jgi:hypothetical protein
MLTLAETLEIAGLLEPALGSQPAATLQALGLDPATMPPLPAIDRPGYVTFVRSCNVDQQIVLCELLGRTDLSGRLRALQQNARPVHPMPWRVLLSGFPVVARHDLWSVLPQMIAGKQRILHVRGGAKSGKTYTRTILGDLYACAPDGVTIRLASVDVDGAGSVKALVDAMLRRIAPNLSAREQEHSTVQWWIGELCQDLLLGCMADSSQQVWLVLDGYAHANLDPNFDQFFSTLCARVIEPPLHVNGPRLVLIDHPDKLPFGIDNYLARETINPIDALEISAFLKARFPPATTKHDQEADRIWQNALAAENAQQMPRLESINLALKDRKSL